VIDIFVDGTRASQAKLSCLTDEVASMRILAVAISLLASLTGTAAAQIMPDEWQQRESFTHYYAGQTHLLTEHWEQATIEFQKAVTLHPYFTDAHYGLGVAYMGMKRYASAALAFQGCLEATRAIHQLGERQRLEYDRLSKELADAMDANAPRSRRALGPMLYQPVGSPLSDQYQPPPRVLLALGSAHFRNGDSGRAEYYWREAVRIDSSLGEAWNNLAAVYAATGRKDDAESAVVNAERAGFRVNPRLKQEIAKK
jgi:Flp pilus assembly protein TadD